MTGQTVATCRDNRRLRFSLRTLILGVVFFGAGYGLYWRWEPWVLLPSETQVISDIALKKEVESRAYREKHKFPRQQEQFQALLNASTITDFAISPKGNMAVICSPDNSVQIWKTGLPQMVCKLKNHEYWHPIEEVVGPGGIVLKPAIGLLGRECKEYSDDEERIIGFTGRNRIGIWDTNTGEVLSELVPSENTLFDAQFSDGGTKITAITYPNPNQIHYFLRRRPEYWWGIAWLPEFWLMVVSGLTLVWGLRRDWKEFGGMKKAAMSKIL